MNPRLSVILPTHNPDSVRLARALDGLRAQTLPAEYWETLLVDNASSGPPTPDLLQGHAPANLRQLFEPIPGLSHARALGFAYSTAPLAVLVDDDNVLYPEFLCRAIDLAEHHPAVGMFGGRVIPEFAAPPPAWTREFDGLIALRDLGRQPILSPGFPPEGTSSRAYPLHAPLGAGMVIRRPAWQAWLEHRRTVGAPSDRRGTELSSGGDNDIVLAALAAGWGAAYFPDLYLTHLIPDARLQPEYLARLNRAIQRSWIGVLRRHNACPWPTIQRWTLGPRIMRAWLRHRAWSSPAARIRWQGAIGHFEGLVSN